MGEKMTPIPFKKLINRILCEYENEKTVFGVRYPYIKKDNKTLELFGEKAETPSVLRQVPTPSLHRT